MTSATIIVGACLVAALAWIVSIHRELWETRRRALRHANLLRARIATLEGEAMAYEARSRGVGGTGEHVGAAVRVIGAASKVSPMHRADRFAIPTDRTR